MKLTRRDMMLSTLSAAAMPGLCATAAVGQPATTPLKVAAVKFGSVNWLLETIKAEGIDTRLGLELTPTELSNNQAGPISLLGGGSDLIVSDWTWALRQRGLGEALKFAPYSSTLGAVVVSGSSPVTSIRDLEGKRLGVAGSGIDKSWLLLQAYCRKTLDFDIAAKATIQFGAAPLLTEQVRDGKLDAVLNFWTQTVRLASLGFREIISMNEVMKALAIDPVPAFVGFIWKEKTQAERGPQIATFLTAAQEANKVLGASDAPWERLKPLMKPINDAEFAAMKAAYRAGITVPWRPADTASAEKIMQVLIANGDTELVGAGTKFDPNLFHVHRT